LVWPVSAVTGAGLSTFLRWVGPLLREFVAQDASEPAAVSAGPGAPLVSWAEGAGDKGGHVTYRPLGTASRAFTVRREKDGFAVKGFAVRRLVSRFDLSNEEAIRYLGERLDRLGVYAALRAQGAQPGDDVEIEGYAFEFQ
jgi:Obg family GTPase CgtA-like protein